MAIPNLENQRVYDEFFADLQAAYSSSIKQYECRGIPDLTFLELGVLRCLSSATTGHEFLQHHAGETQQHYEPSHFFKALKSQRRLDNLVSTNQRLADISKHKLTDHLLQCPELDEFDVYAGDGHYHKAACFDKPIMGKKRASGHFFRLNLRNHFLDYIAPEDPEIHKGKKKKHDMAVLKQTAAEVLRNCAPKGRKVLYAWDKACIDYQYWKKLKFNHGVYFVTLEKSNSAAEQMSNNLADMNDPRNEGIVMDVLIGAGGATMRRIIYTDPKDGKTYTFITNEMTLPAFAIVLTYKHRWDIEKVFYQLKSKFNERKSWASSKVAKQAHAQFECLTHNLCLLLEQVIQEVGMVDKVEFKKSKGRAKSRKNRADETLKNAKNYINTALPRATHRTQRFIRWLRSQVYKQVAWEESMGLLAIVWGTNS